MSGIGMMKTLRLSCRIREQIDLSMIIAGDNQLAGNGSITVVHTGIVLTVRPDTENCIAQCTVVCVKFEIPCDCHIVQLPADCCVPEEVLVIVGHGLNVGIALVPIYR